MVFLPFQKMQERLNAGKSDSDTTYFTYLMYFGEMLLKLITVGVIASIEDDKERSRYRLNYNLVRANGLGEWESALSDALVGPPSRSLLNEARNEQRELTQKCGPGSWQHRAVASLDKCLELLEVSRDPMPSKVDVRRWFTYFSQLRNKTRGHGAFHSDILGRLNPVLEESLLCVSSSTSLFRREWAFLHQNLSGKYRVTKLTDTSKEFDYLKSSVRGKYPDGIYISFSGKLKLINLAYSTGDVADFFFANGGFNGKKFETLSYISGDTVSRDATPYLAPTESLPKSETHGLEKLDIQGNCFVNLPPPQRDYVHRGKLEEELSSVLEDDGHPVVTLVGRGGIGKTSLALIVCHALCHSKRFVTILWFSGRDLDLLPEGPKQVRPAVLDVRDVAGELIRLLEVDSVRPGYAEQYLTEVLCSPKEIGPCLFVFDNFETFANPSELFKWIDTYVRPPNKVLITTRFREFKGDYPIEVSGMTEEEGQELIEATAKRLGVAEMLTSAYRQALLSESDGHPYVIKVLLGEVSKSKTLGKIERLVADSDDILQALFERTYATLSPAAQRIFLTLCRWRSTIPLVALKAVLLRPVNERMEVDNAVDELERSSFLELLKSEADGEIFVNVPLVASIFGRKKLAVSPMSIAIEVDVNLLWDIGVGHRSDVRFGIAPRIERLFRAIARKVTQKSMGDYLPILEFIARHHPAAWLLLADLYEELEGDAGLEESKKAVRHFLEEQSQQGDSAEAWGRLVALCRRTSDILGEAHALLSLCQKPGAPFEEISRAANRMNTLLSHYAVAFASEEKQVLVKKLIETTERRISSGNATDRSRLAWLCIRVRDEESAIRHVQKGLEIEPDNEYCVRLAERLNIVPPEKRSIGENAEEDLKVGPEGGHS